MLMSILKLILLAVVFYMNFLSRIIMSPLLPELKTGFSMSTGMASRVFLFLSLGYFTSQLASGFVSSRITHKWTIFSSLVMSALFLILIAFSTNILMLFISVFALGLSTGLYLPSGISTITTLFDERFWGRAVSIHELAPNLAFVTAPLIASFVLMNTSWQHLMYGLAMCFATAGFILSLTSIGEFRGTAPGLSACNVYLRKRQFWLMLMLFGLGISSTIGIYNMLPIFLVSEHHFSEADANAIVGLSRVATLFTALIGGVMSDRFGAKRVICWVLLFTGFTTVLLGVVQGTMLKIAVFLQPLLAVCFFPPAFAALSEISNPQDRNLLISMIIPFAYMLGAGIMPSFIGILADIGFFRQGFIVAGIFLLCGHLICSFLEPSQEILRSES